MKRAEFICFFVVRDRLFGYMFAGTTDISPSRPSFTRLFVHKILYGCLSNLSPLSSCDLLGLVVQNRNSQPLLLMHVCRKLVFHLTVCLANSEKTNLNELFRITIAAAYTSCSDVGNPYLLPG
jgi:hypothetical protein